MTEQGYVSIGFSGFHTTGSVTQEQLLSQAKTVGADKVVYYQKYMSTEKSTVPLTLPNTQTTYHSGTVSSYGGGFGTFGGTSTTYGTQTTYIPVTNHRYEYAASFWRKVKRQIFGASFSNLDDNDKQTLETNFGVKLIAIIENSPAHSADLISGDIIRSVNDQRIKDFNELMSVLTKKAGSNIDLIIYRNGRELTKTVKLNSPSS